MNADIAPGSQPDSPRVALRRATPADCDLLLDMNAEYCTHEGVAYDAARARAGIGPLLIDDAHGSIHMIENLTTEETVGYAVIAHSWSVEIGGPEVVLDELYVRTRNHGIGGHAIELLAQWCTRRGILRMFLETEQPNARARALYTRHGFEAQDSIWMSRDL